MDEALEFEMDEADMEFVRKTLPAQKLTIKEEKFEAIVDRLEKESYKQVSRQLHNSPFRAAQAEG